MKNIIKTLACICAAFVLASCNHKPLWYGNDLFAYLDVLFDWTRATGDPQPASVDLYLFPEKGGAPQYDQKPLQGGTLRVPYGNYYALAFNNDTGSILVSGTDSLNTFKIYTRGENILAPMGMSTKADLRAKGTEDQRIVLAPDRLWVGRKPDFNVEFKDEKTVHTIYMEDRWQEIFIEIRGVKNFKYLASVSGALSGLAGGYLPGLDKLTDEQVIMPFEGLKLDAEAAAAYHNALESKVKRAAALTKDQSSDSVFGQLVCFGHCPETVNKHILTVYTVLNNGEKYMFSYDVTDQYHDQWNQRQVYLVIDELPLPVPISGGGGEGMSLSMDDWDNVDILINMK